MVRVRQRASDCLLRNYLTLPAWAADFCERRATASQPPARHPSRRSAPSAESPRVHRGFPTMRGGPLHGRFSAMAEKRLLRRRRAFPLRATNASTSAAPHPRARTRRQVGEAAEAALSQRPDRIAIDDLVGVEEVDRALKANADSVIRRSPPDRVSTRANRWSWPYKRSERYSACLAARVICTACRL